MYIYTNTCWNDFSDRQYFSFRCGKNKLMCKANVSKLQLVYVYFSKALQSVDFDLYQAFCTLIYSATILIVYCFFGTLSTRTFEKYGEYLYELSWYTLTTKQQKYIVLMIENAQQRLCFHGFHMISLNLETFVSVTFD